MSLSKKWKKFWDNESFVYLRVWMKNFRNKEFFSKKNIFQVHINGEENRGAAVYKIWIDGGEAGFFALQRFVLDGLYVADVCGFKPYILITNTKYNRTSAVDDNMFDYYYDQPCYSSAVLNQSGCVIDFDLDHRRWLEDQFVTGDGMLSGYEFKPELIERLGKGMENLADSANAMNGMASATASTDKFVNSLDGAADAVNSLKHATEAVNTLTTIYQETAQALTSGDASYADEMKKLAGSLASVNAMYEMQLQTSTSQLEATKAVEERIQSMMTNFADSAEGVLKYKDQVNALTRKVAELNNVYGNMLAAMQTKL